MKQDFYHFGMARATGTYLAVGGIFYRTVAVSTDHILHAIHIAVNGIQAPEAAAGKHSGICFQTIIAVFHAY
jgi:hypothetical protein